MNLQPALQPIRCVKTGKTVAAEALARWQQGQRVLTPAQVKGAVDWAAVDLQLVRCLQSAIDPLRGGLARLFLNVSPATMACDTSFHAWLRAVLALDAAHPSLLVIEITECIPDRSLALRWPALHRAGLAIALDDFGDHFSSLERLISYPWGYCKFDARRQMSTAEIAGFQHCQQAGIRVIAEKVETAVNAQLAMQRGLRLQQGYLHGLPVLISQFQQQNLATALSC